MHDTQNNTIKQVEYIDGFQYAGGVLSSAPAGSFAKIFLKDFLTLRPPTAEGYVAATQNENSIGPKYIYNYVYNYTDHLGNIRLSYTRDPLDLSLKIMEENHSTSCASFDLEILNFQNLTCPFGLKHAVYADPKQMYKLDEEEENLARPTYVYETEYQYKYNGKEFQDELGLNWYDYQARNYDPALGRWFNIDPAAELSRRNSPYAYALNNPVFFIDPDGMFAESFDVDDDFKLNQDGSIELIQRTDATTDTLYATDAGGNVDQNNSITVNKGVLENTETVQIPDQISDPDNIIPTRIMDATATENSQELFEFMADNTTNVEHSIANFENGKTFIGTSFREHAELSLTHTMNSGNGALNSYDHSHPGGTGSSSDDMAIAGKIEDMQPGKTPTFRIYNPSTGGYSTYDRNIGGTELNEATIIIKKK